jgi:hypothetical protein
LDKIKEKVFGNLKKFQKKKAKMLFGIEVDPPSKPFPIKPNKLKIFVGFFQIFGNFRDAFVINWSPEIRNLMNLSSQFNLVFYVTKLEILCISCIDSMDFCFLFIGSCSFSRG